MGRDTLLFFDERLDDYLAAKRTAMGEEIRALPREQLLQVDEEAWANALADRYTVAPVRLLEEEMFQRPPEEIEIDVSGDRDRYFRPGSRPVLRGYRSRVVVPFEGDPNLFRLRANRFTTNPPRAIVSHDGLVIENDYLPNGNFDIAANARSVIDTVRQWLSWSEELLVEHEGRLRREALAAIQSRRQALEQETQRAEASGIPIRSGPGAKRSITDAIIRRPSPLPARAAGGRPIKLEPTLRQEIFEDVLAILRQAGREIERRPAAYAGAREEDLRHHLMVPLNVSYRGQASAEAFNHSGKTDILLRFEGQNLFIAECKIWKGEKSFTDALDQLFGYAAWRDTKLALVIFVKDKGLTSVVKKARTALEAHTRFRRAAATGEETELRTTMAWPGDDERLVEIHVMFVHTHSG